MIRRLSSKRAPASGLRGERPHIGMGVHLAANPGASAPPLRTLRTVVNAHADSSAIRFLADGRANELDSRAGEFVAVFGDLLAGPPFRVGLVIPFTAKLSCPDGSTLYAQAQLDYPADPDLVEEAEYMVLPRCRPAH